MKEKVLKNLQTFAKGIFVPVLILPIVGISRNFICFCKYFYELKGL